MIIILLGSQGSGKGTQADLLSQKLGYFHMESGKMLREMSTTNQRIANYLNQGKLVPDEETIQYMDEYLKKNGRGFESIIFDGYPRTVNQYEVLVHWLNQKKEKIDLVIHLDISEEESIKRLSARRTCLNCGAIFNLVTNPPKTLMCDHCGGELIQRDDDKPDLIRKRLELYYEQTKPILELVEKEKILVTVDGERPIEMINEEILKIVKERQVQNEH